MRTMAHPGPRMQGYMRRMLCAYSAACAHPHARIQRCMRTSTRACRHVCALWRIRVHACRAACVVCCAHQRCMRTFTRACRHVCAQHTAHRVLHARVVCAYRYSSFRSAPTLTITPRRSSGKMATGVYLHFMNAICPPKLSCRLVCFFPPCPLLGGTPTAKRPAMKRRWMQAVLYEILKTLREPAGLQQHACLRWKYTPSRDRVCAANGFVCIVNGVRRRIYARGIWFPLDTPMRNKFWGVSRGQACTRCIKRVGTSAFTAGPPKSGGHIRQLLADVRSHERRAAAGEPGADRAAQSARERMRRHGHHPESHVLTRLLGSQYGNLLLLHSQLGVQGLDNQGDYLHRDLLNFCGVYFCGATNAVMASVHGCRDEFNRRMRAVPKQHSRHGGCASRKCPIITADSSAHVDLHALTQPRM